MFTIFTYNYLIMILQNKWLTYQVCIILTFLLLIFLNPTYWYTNYCWDGIINTHRWEQCDDGNYFSWDGCSIVCEKEYGLQSIIKNECNDGIDNDLDGLTDSWDSGCLNSSDNSEWNSIGTSYYVALKGDDSNNGSFASPFGTLQKALDIAQSGDTIFLRSGRHSSGQVDTFWRTFIAKLKRDAAVNSPITITSYNNEDAIIDGWIAFNWQSCINNSLCNSHPNAAEIFVWALPEWVTRVWEKMTEWQIIIPMTRDIPAKDAFFHDNVREGHKIPVGLNYTPTTIQDPSVFTNPDANYYVGKSIWINSCNNNFFNIEISAYNPSTHTVTLAKKIACDQKFLTENKDRYVIANHPDTLKKWEFYYDKASNSIVYWSRTWNIPSTNVRLPFKTYGLVLDSRSNYVIDRLKFQNFRGDHISARVGNRRRWKNIVIKNSEFINAGSLRISTFDDIQLTRNTYTQNSNILVSGANNADISYNYVNRSIGSWIASYTNKNSKIRHNTVENSHGHHGNGITGWYIWNDELLVEHNFVRNANIPLTFGGSRNLTYRYNVFDGTAVRWVAAQWWLHQKAVDLKNENVLFENNTFIGRVNTSAWYENVVLKNNILYDSNIEPGSKISNNLYIQTPSSMRDINDTNVIEKDLSKVFVDHMNADFRLVPGIQLWTPPYDGDASTMSTNNSYVGALPPRSCQNNNPTAIFSVDKTNIYQWDIVTANASNSILCWGATKFTDYIWKVDGRIIASWHNLATISHQFKNQWTFILSLTITDNNGKRGTFSKNIFALPAALPWQVLHLNAENTSNDISWRNNHGKWQNASGETVSGRYTDGKKGKAFLFSNNWEYIRFSHKSDFVWMWQLSLMAWAKRWIAWWGVILSRNASYQISLWTWKANFFINSDSSRAKTLSVDVPDDTKWHHYAMTYDGRVIIIYIDGVEVKRANYNGAIYVGNPGASWALSVGRRSLSGKVFKGSIDNVRIFDKWLTQAEVRNIFNTIVTPQDTDKDGIPDTRDNCVNIPNQNQLDTDNDGIWNVCDTDDDGDGILDVNEKQGCVLNADRNCWTIVTPQEDVKWQKWNSWAIPWSNQKNITIKKDKNVQKANSSKNIYPSQKQRKKELLDILKNRKKSWLVEHQRKKSQKTKTNYTQWIYYKDTCSIVKNIQLFDYFLQRQNDYIFTDEGYSAHRMKIRKFQALNVINGYSDGSFRPKAGVTRVEFLKILLKTHCYNYQNIDTKYLQYKDVNKKSWQAKVIQKSEDLGLVNGDTNSKWERIFRPNDVITKLESLKIIMNLSSLKPSQRITTNYLDIKIPWHKKYIDSAESLWLYDAYLDRQIFNAHSSVKREDMIDLIDRTVQLYK